MVEEEPKSIINEIIKSVTLREHIVIAACLIMILALAVQYTQFISFRDELQNMRIDISNIKPANCPLPSTNNTVQQQPVFNSSKGQIDLTGRVGEGTGSLKIVEFADYECPFCSSVQPTIKQLETEYNGKITFYFMNFPLTNIHPYALNASEAAECAGAQGKFWEYHDLLYNNSDKLTTLDLERYANGLGLDSPTFDSCLESGSMAELVMSQEQVGLQHGVEGTPTFFINGDTVEGAQPIGAFEAVINKYV